ncbi:MAG: hypothetical protein HC897_14370 [Thermoanaerobaculia bacterium]|nr:hypothetical protein [Thermoanaerobaculia bacterium]
MRLNAVLIIFVLASLRCSDVAARLQSPWSPERLPYAKVLALSASNGRTIALVESASGTKFLLGISHDGSKESRGHPLDEQAEDFELAGERALAWRFDEKEAAGRLWLIDLATQETTVITDRSVINSAHPTLVGDRIWWISTATKHEEVVYREPARTGRSIPLKLPLLRSPNEDPPNLQFGSSWIVATTTGNAGLWLWRPTLRGWQSVTPNDEHAIEEIFEERLFGRTIGDACILVLDLLHQQPRWDQFYCPDEIKGIEIVSNSLRYVNDSKTLVLLEKSPTQDRWLVELSLEDAKILNRWSIPPELPIAREGAFWAWDGSRLTIAYQEKDQWWVVSWVPQGSEAVAQRSLNWLKARLTPPFQRPDSSFARLIDSYEDDARVGWTYDAALATIALTAAGETTLARELLRGLEGLQEKDGSWPFAFDPDHARPLEGKRYAGAIAWVVMAANYFESATDDRTFALMARNGLGFLEQLRQKDSTVETFGAVAIGPHNPTGYSTEHNVDAWSAFYWRGRLDQEPRYLEISEQIRDFVLDRQWATDATGAGYFEVGHRDDALYLDAQSWTVLAFWPHEQDHTRLRSALSTAENRLRSTNARLGPCEDVEGFKEAEGAGIGEKVWSEGTAGMVAAFRMAGERERATHYYVQLARCQSPSGGLAYSSENADGWSTIPSVAGTAWLFFNALEPPINPFNPPPRAEAAPHAASQPR